MGICLDLLLSQVAINRKTGTVVGFDFDLPNMLGFEARVENIGNQSVSSMDNILNQLSFIHGCPACFDCVDGAIAQHSVGETSQPINILLVAAVLFF